MTSLRTPALGDAVPLRRGTLLRWLGRFGLWLLGFHHGPPPPNRSKGVIIFAPHTSNWDFPVCLAAMLALGLKAYWLGKHSLFWGPFKPLLQALGGIAVRRDKKHGLVDNAVQRFAEQDKFMLAISPEGTRKKVQHWKTGFYFIAERANVPILTCYIDYEKKEIGFGPILLPSGDLEGDLRKLKEYFQAFRGKNPEQFS